MASQRRDANVIEGLVAAIRDHSEFRQLSCYSIECLTKALSNKYGCQMEAMETAIDCGAASVVMDIMLKYSGLEDVLERCADCLWRIALDPKTAALIAHHDGFNALFISIIDRTGAPRSTESISKALYLVETVISHPNILQNINCKQLIEHLSEILKKFHEDINIILHSVKSFERIARNVELKKFFLSSGVIRTLLDVMEGLMEKMSHNQKQNIDDETFLAVALCVTKVLTKLIMDSEDTVAAIRNEGGANVYLRFQQKIFSLKSDILSRLGGRLLCKLIEKDPVAIMEQLNASVTSEEEFERNLDLFLTISQHHHRLIRELSENDMKCLCEKLCNPMSDKARLSLSRVLLLISSYRDTASTLLSSRSIEFVCKSLSSNYAMDQSILNTLETLQNLVRYCGSSENITSTMTQQVLNLYDEKNSSSDLVASILNYILSVTENMNTKKSTDSLMKPCVDFAIGAIKRHTREGIQVKGTSLLLKICCSQKLFTYAGNSFDRDFVSQLILNINKYSSEQSNLDLVLASLQLLSIIMSWDHRILQNQKESCISAVSFAMVSYQNNDDIISFGIFIINNLSSETYVKDVAESFKRCCIESDRMMNISMVVMTVGALAIGERDLPMLFNLNVLEVLVETYFLASKTDGFDQESLVAMTQSLTFLIKRSNKACEFILKFNLIFPASLILSNRVKDEKLVNVTLVFMQRLTCSSSTSDMANWDMAEIIDSITSVLHLYLNDVSLIPHAINLLYVLMKKDIEIDLSGTDTLRRIVAFLRDRLFERIEIPILLKCLDFIAYASKYDINSKSLRRWGCVDVILNIVSAYEYKRDGLVVKVRTALQYMVDEKDIDILVEKLRILSENMDTDFNILNAEAQVSKLGFLLLCCDYTNCARKDNCVRIIQSILSFASSMKGSRAQREYTKLLTTCIETVCRSFHGSEGADQFLKIHLSFLLNNLKETPSLHLCSALLCIIEMNGSKLELDLKRIAEALIAIVQKGDADTELAYCGIKILLALQHVKTDVIITTHNGLFFICEYISILLENYCVVGITEGLRYMEIIGSTDPFALVNNQVLDTIIDVLRNMSSTNKADPAIFYHGMNIIKIIATGEVGLELVDSKNIAPMLVGIYSKCIGSRTPFSAIVSYMSAIIELSKNMNMKLTFVSHGMINYLHRTIGAYPFNKTIISNATALIYALKDGCSLHQLKQLVQEIFETVNKLESEEGHISANLIILLQDCGNLMIEQSTMAHFDFLELLNHLRRLLDITKKKYYECAQQKIRSLVMIILHRLLVICPLEGQLEVSYFLSECSIMVNRSTFLYQASVFAFWAKLVRFENGILIIAQPDILHSMRKALASSNGSEANDLDIDVAEATNMANALSEEIINQAKSISKSKEGIMALKVFFCNMDDHIVTRVIVSIPMSTLLEITGHMITEQIPEKYVQIAVETMLSATKEENLLPHCSLCSIASVCSIVPKAIDLFAIFSGAEEGVNALATCPRSFEVIGSVLTTDSIECVCSAASIFSDCVIAGNESVFRQMQEVGVAVLLLDALKDPTKLACEEFVQDVLYVIGSLLSVIGALRLKLGHKYIECIENAKVLHKKNEYISQVANDIILDLRENLNEEKEILKQLQHLEDLHIEVQAKQKKRIVSSGDRASSDENFSNSKDIEAELEVLLALIRDFDQELSFIDTSDLLSLIDILVSYTGNIHIVKVALSVFKKLKPLSWVVEMLTKKSKLTCIVDIIRQVIVDSDLVGTLLQILTISTRDTCQNLEYLMNFDTLLAINNTISTFIEVENIVINGSEILSNLFVRHQMKMDITNEAEIKVLIINAIKLYIDNDRVNRNMLLCMYTIVRQKDFNVFFKGEISLFAAIFENLYHCPDIVILVLKILGIFSLSDILINEILNNGIVRFMICALENYIGSADILQLAVMVLSNLGIMEDKENERDNVQFVGEQGGQKFLLRCIDRHPSNSALVHVVMKALCDLYDADLFHHDDIRHCLRAMENFVYDHEIMTWASKGVSLFIATEQSLISFYRWRGIEIFVDSMAKNTGPNKFIEYSSLSLANAIAAVDITATFSDQSSDWVAVLISCLEVNLDNDRSCTYLFSIFALLVREDIALEVLSQEGLHLLIRASQIHLEHIAVATYLIEIVGQLSFVPQYACDILLNGCVKLLFQLLEIYSDNSSLVAGILQTLLNIMRISDECMLILSASGTEETVKEVIFTHDKDCREVHDLGQKILHFFREREINDGNIPSTYDDMVEIDKTYFKEDQLPIRHQIVK